MRSGSRPSTKRDLICGWTRPARSRRRADIYRPIEANCTRGFECDHWDPNDVFENCPDIDFGRAWSIALAFRFGGDFLAMWGTYAAAAAYSRATDGVLFDGESGDIMQPDKAVAFARDLERDLPRLVGADT